MLNERQKKFCEYYVACGNAAEAARKAGYSTKSARQKGHKLLTKTDIAQYIRELSASPREKRISEAVETLRFYTRVMRGEEKDAFGLEPSLDDRLKAAASLLRVHEIGERGTSAEERLDKMLAEFKEAVLYGAGAFADEQ